MELGTCRMSQTVVDTQVSRIEGHPSQSGCRVHLFTRFYILTIFVGFRQIFKDQLNRLFSQGIGEVGRLSGYIGFNSMCQHIHSCICCDVARKRHNQIRIQNSNIRQNFTSHQRILGAFVCICDNRKVGHFRSSSACCRNGDENSL